MRTNRQTLLEKQWVFGYTLEDINMVITPPIDPDRENLAMSLMSYVGREKNLLDETPEHVRRVKLPHPLASILKGSRPFRPAWAGCATRWKK